MNTQVDQIKENIKKRIKVAERSELNLRLGGYQNTTWPVAEQSVLKALLLDIEKIEKES